MRNFIGIIILALYLFKIAESCTAFYCLNSCGASKTDKSKKGFKAITAVNRDEDIYRPTIDAKDWMPKTLTKSGSSSYKLSDNYIRCDLSKNEPPFNLCAYGALDTKNGEPPNYYSTWLGVNERGTIGNLLFFMNPSNRASSTKPRGIVVTDYLINSSWPSPESYMQYLADSKVDFGPFSYLHMEMSPKSGRYSMFYLNNNDTTNKYEILTKDDKDQFIFGISNSDPAREFNKVKVGRERFGKLINDYSEHMDKDRLVSEIMNLLQDSTPNYPDTTLASFMQMTDPAYENSVKGVSAINADYTGFWRNAHSRTSTLILIDQDDNAEYYEYNLTNWRKIDDTHVGDKEWKMNSFKFKLNPLYKNNSNKQINVKLYTLLLSVLISITSIKI